MTKLEIGLWAAGSRDILQHRTLDPETRSSRIPAKLPTALAITHTRQNVGSSESEGRRAICVHAVRLVGDVEVGGGWGMGDGGGDGTPSQKLRRKR